MAAQKKTTRRRSPPKMPVAGVAIGTVAGVGTSLAVAKWVPPDKQNIALALQLLADVAALGGSMMLKNTAGNRQIKAALGAFGLSNGMSAGGQKLLSMVEGGNNTEAGALRLAKPAEIDRLIAHLRSQLALPMQAGSPGMAQPGAFRNPDVAPLNLSEAGDGSYFLAY